MTASVRAAAAVALVAALCVALPAGAGLRPRYGGRVAAALPQAPRSFDPAQAASVAELFAASLLHQPPLRRGPDGALASMLLAEPPRSRDGGRTFQLRLRPGLRFHDGRPIRAADLAASLRHLEPGPWAALLLPVRALDVRSELELHVRLAFPYPRWPEALAEVAAGVLPAGAAGEALVGAGPFRLAAREKSGLVLEAFAGHAAGRPFLDGVALLHQPDRRGASRLVASGDAALGPAAAARAPRATWLFVGSGHRLDLADVIDRSDLLRYFVPGAAAPLERLLPAPHEAPLPAPEPSPVQPATPLDLLFDPAVEGHRLVAERIQLRLHDRGIATRVVAIGGAALRARAAAGDYALALVQLPLPADPGLAAATLLRGAGRVEAARRLLTAVGAAGTSRETATRAGAAALAGVRGIVPLYAAPEAILPAAGALQGGTDLADAWLLSTEPATP